MMRELLTRWASLEPEKIEHEQWNDELAFKVCDEFRINGIAVFSDLFRFGESSPALIQWAVQEAIVSRGWGLELDYYSGNDGWRATVKPGPRWATGGSSNATEAILAAYLQALESEVKR